MLPSVQVMKFFPELTHSVWVDFQHQFRTLNGLTKYLNKCVREGKYGGYRLVHVYWQGLGCCKRPTEHDFREPKARTK